MFDVFCILLLGGCWVAVDASIFVAFPSAVTAIAIRADEGTVCGCSDTATLAKAKLAKLVKRAPIATRAGRILS